MREYYEKGFVDFNNSSTPIFCRLQAVFADPEQFLRYWSAEVSAADYSIDKMSYTNAEGSLCVPSADNVTVTVKLNNPESITLITPKSSANAGKVILFPELSTQPEYGETKDYTLQQEVLDTLTLVYKSFFYKRMNGVMWISELALPSSPTAEEYLVKTSL